MKSLFVCIQVEFYKAFRSKFILISSLAFTMAPFMAGFFMYVIKNPDLAKQSGLLGQQAQIAGKASWPSYIQVQSQMIAVGGILIFGFIVSWIFGREYVDGMIKELLSLPFSRHIIVTAKFIVAFLINVIVMVYIVFVGLVIGLFIKLPYFSIDLLMSGYRKLFMVSLLTVFLSMPVAFFACFGRGYLAPIGFIIFTLVFSQVLTAIGYGDFFPWAIPALYSGLSESIVLFTRDQLLLIFIASVIGIGGTYYWVFYADQH